MTPEIEIECEHGAYPHVCAIRIDGRLFKLIESPFGNCQSFGMNHFMTFMRYCQTHPEVNVFDLINKIRQTCDVYDRNLMIVDIYQSFSEFIKNNFNTVFIQEYTNLTGSKMIMCGIDLSKEVD